MNTKILKLAYLLPTMTLLAANSGNAAEAGSPTYFHEIDRPTTHTTVAITPHNETQQAQFVVMEKYQLRAGDKISETIAEWCKRSGWSLSWDAPELLSEADVDVNGQFEAVVEMVLDALNRSGAKISATFYDANRVLRITEKK